MFYHCNQQGSTLKCDVFQTLIFVDKQKPNACTVLNDYSSEEFRWDERTQSWISREGPVGPCGRLTIGTLERDPSSTHYWQYTMKKYNEKPNGVFAGKTCDQVAPGSTFHYTWRASPAQVKCTSVVNLMN